MGGSDIIDQAPMARSVKALFPAPGAVILNVSERSAFADHPGRDGNARSHMLTSSV